MKAFVTSYVGTRQEGFSSAQIVHGVFTLAAETEDAARGKTLQDFVDKYPEFKLCGNILVVDVGREMEPET